MSLSAMILTVLQVASPSLLATANALAKATVAASSGCSVRECLMNAQAIILIFASSTFG